MTDGFFLGPLKIYYYSLCLLVAVWAGYALAVRLGKLYHFSVAMIGDIVALALVSGVIGGRIGFLIQNIPYFSQNPGEILKLTSGGLSIHGAIIAGAIALTYYAKIHKFSVKTLTDFAVLPLLVGQIIGRLGNYFNQELFGYPTALPWAVHIDPSHRPVGYFTQQTFHPTFAYEMILNTIGFFVLWQCRDTLKKPGQLTLAYLIIFSCSRFIVELFRISDRYFWQLSLAQIISLIVFVAANILLHQSYQTKSKS